MTASSLVLGLDIGGANIKAATSHGDSVNVPFAIWKSPEELPEMLRQIGFRWGLPETVLITMTAELADCFPDKASGVRAIAAAVAASFQDSRIAIYCVTGRFETVAQVLAEPLPAAASNWHALALAWARTLPGESGLLLDIGSTTSDVIPFANGRVVARGTTDFTRLQAGELVYTGVLRTPLCAVASHVRIGDTPVPVAAEWFATTRDVYLLTGDLVEQPDDCETADHRPATRAHAAARLLRMVCADASECSINVAHHLAAQFAEAQKLQLRSAVRQVLKSLAPRGPTRLVVSGGGSFLARKVFEETPELIGTPIESGHCDNQPADDNAGCAQALLVLWRAEIGET